MRDCLDDVRVNVAIFDAQKRKLCDRLEDMCVSMRPAWMLKRGRCGALDDVRVNAAIFAEMRNRKCGIFAEIWKGKFVKSF